MVCIITEQPAVCFALCIVTKCIVRRIFSHPGLCTCRQTVNRKYRCIHIKHLLVGFYIVCLIKEKLSGLITLIYYTQVSRA